MGRDKALIVVGGRPMAAIVASVLVSAGCQEVVAVGGDPAVLASLPLPVIADIEPGSGPLGGVVAALEWCVADADRETTSWMVIAACDLPLLTPQLVISLVDAARRHPDADVVVAVTDRVEPAMAIWRTASVARVRALFDDGERALHRALAALHTVQVAVDPAQLRNVNTPSDLPRYPEES